MKCLLSPRVKVSYSTSVKNFICRLLIITCVLPACSWRTAEKGTQRNPIRVSLIPSKEAQALLHDAKDFTRWMEKETGLSFEVSIPTSYVAVVEAMGGQKVDIAYLNTTTYFLAQEKYGAEVQFISISASGSTNYRGQIIVRADSHIKTIQDLQGKKIAYVDPTSASGYILPAYLLKNKNIQPRQAVFAGRHDAVVTMVYQKQVDAGATFYSVPEKGKMMDARRLIETQYPDVWERIKILEFTTSLANDAIVFRAGLDTNLKEKLATAMVKWAASPEGAVTLKAINNASGLKHVTDADYQESRKIIKEMSQALNF